MSAFPFLGPPKLEVMADYGSQVGEALSTGSKAALSDVVADRRRRQAMFLKRQPGRSWRPAKRYRTGERSFLLAVDIALRWGSAGSSLQRFQLPAAPADRGPAIEWPKLHVAVDLESVGISAIHFLVRAKALGLCGGAIRAQGGGNG